MHEPARRSPLIPLARVATLVAIGDLVTKQLAVLWIGTLEQRASSAVIRFGVVHNDKGAFGLSLGNYTWELSLALTLAAIALIVPVAKDLSRIDDRAPTALGLIAGGAIGNLVSLLMNRAGVVDFIALQRADGVGIVLNAADVAAYAGVAMLARTAARVVSAIRRNRESAIVELGKQRDTALNRLADIEVPRAVAQEGVGSTEATSPAPRAPRPVADREVSLRIIHADGGPDRRGRGLAARLRDRDGGARATNASQYLRPMSHIAENRPGR
jgi:lipoprotein signal peptidase